MAKQTFTTGQVLTAAQMTSLQQTAMGGGAATAKTANYVLVAADAGTTVAMNAAGATTITVNTGLFAAGDTVFIQNLGAGACTVTAGTATVATAGSLILPQNDAGILYFTSASAAIFYDYIQAGAVSPLTTKGDLYTFGTSDTRLGVGANDTILVADSAEATGLKWATPAGGGSLTQLATGTLSGATTRVQSLSASYKGLKVIVRGFQPTTDGYNLEIRLNNDSAARYQGAPAFATRSTVAFGANEVSAPAFGAEASATNSLVIMDIWDYANTTTYKQFQYYGICESSTTAGSFNAAAGSGFYNQIGAINEITFFADGDTFAGGTYFVYGVN